jgi:hypothetical protein
MPTISLKRKTTWDIDQWRDFGRRCQDVRTRLDALIKTFPETRGLTSKILNGFISAHGKFVLATMDAESLLCRQHPGCDDESARIIRGDGGTHWLPSRIRVKRDAPTLSREEWIDLGNRAKRLRDDIGTLGMELQKTAGRSTAVADKFIAVSEFSATRSLLDSLVVEQHPDWPDATRVFYGPPLQKTA